MGKLTTCYHCEVCGGVISSGVPHICPGAPTMRVYEPMDVWVLEVGAAYPRGALLVRVVRVGRTLMHVWCRPAVDDREERNADTTVRTYIKPL